MMIDVFRQDAFSMVSLAASADKIPYNPQFLGSLNMFSPPPQGVRSKNVSVEQRDGVLSLVQTTPRGAPLPQRTTEKRSMRPFATSRLAEGDTITASEIAAIRAFGTESELMQAQAEVARRMSGPTGLRALIEYTHENMRLGAIQGIVTDADASTIVNYYTEFGIAQPAELAFDFGGANKYVTADAIGLLRKFIQANVVRPMARAGKGAFLPTTQIYALCGDNFFDDLTSHGEVRTTYLNQQAASELRRGNAFEQFDFGGVTWVNYRGSDDGTTVGINTDKVKFFPVGAPGVFIEAFSPADEFFPFVGQVGQPIYPIMILDDERQSWVKIEVYSYPLFMCTRPEVLLRGKRGA